MADYGLLGDAIGRALADYYKGQIDLEGNIIPRARREMAQTAKTEEETAQLRALAPFAPKLKELEARLKEFEAKKAEAFEPYLSQLAAQETEKGGLEIRRLLQELGWEGRRVFQGPFGDLYVAGPGDRPDQVITLRPPTAKPLDVEEEMKVRDAQALSEKVGAIDLTQPDAPRHVAQAILQHPMGANYLRDTGALSRLLSPHGDVRFDSYTTRAAYELYGKHPSALTQAEWGPVNKKVQEMTGRTLAPKGPEVSTTVEISPGEPLEPLIALPQARKEISAVVSDFISKFDEKDLAKWNSLNDEGKSAVLTRVLTKLYPGYNIKGRWDPVKKEYYAVTITLPERVKKIMREKRPQAAGDVVSDMADIMARFREAVEGMD